MKNLIIYILLFDIYLKFQNQQHWLVDAPQTILNHFDKIILIVVAASILTISYKLFSD